MEVGVLERFWEMKNDNSDIEENICGRHFLETFGLRNLGDGSKAP